MCTQYKEAKHLGIEFLQHFAYREKISQRLGHLLIVHTHKAVVHPVIHKLAPMCALGLRDFILVMRKLQVGATTMNIKMITQ